MMESKTARVLAWSSALAISLSGTASAQRPGYTQQVSLPQGTVLRAELNDTLSSTNSRPGERFTATIKSDEDGSGLPRGTQVVGQVQSVRRASEKQPGIVDVDFRTLQLPDGRTYPIQASLTSLDSKNIRRTSSGRLESTGRSSNDKNKFIGYGAGAGAIIGALGGGNLLTSALLGAAAGYLYGQLNKDKQSNNGRYSDVNLKSGTEFGVELNQQMALAVPAVGNSRYDDRSTDRPYNRPYDRSNGRYSDPNAPYNQRPGGGNGYGRDRTDRSRNADIRVFVNDREVRFTDDRPFMSGARVMLPLVPVLDAAGYRYDYNSGDRELTLHGNRGDTRVIVGDAYARVDGERVRLDAPVERIDGVLFVPTQLLEESTGIRSDWNATDRTLRLTTRYRASLPYDSNGARAR